MKITFILPGFSRFPVGGFQVVYQYANYLSSKGYDVEVIHAMFLPTQKTPTLVEKSKYVVKQLLLSCGIIKPWFKLDPKVKVTNKGRVTKEMVRDADRVVATAWETAEFVNTLPNRCGLKYYFIQHYEVWGGKERVDATWKLPLKKVVIASWLKNIATSLGENAELVPNFVEHENFYLTNAIEQRSPIISMLYSEYPIKGSSDGLKALELIKAKYPNVLIKLFGVFDEPENLPEDTQYFKTPSRSVLRDQIYNESAIYVFPSLSEGWGLTATEAMACGAALCSTDNGGVDDFGVDGLSALISPINDPVSLFKNIERLLLDSSLRVKIAQNGLEKVAELTFEHSGQLFEKAIL
ncbi:glycosyltransferase family 4 protein [Lactiplantibacillus songbeiensis]|uniref:Glycosyltransferase family 4 protein n=1 Tax=Lactiplantibacillus songbeiensis TaxID=2559920 RepID=A0ABW4C152_9LACO|nr:glycosyltransferase family 4 protein [Lactiplantibacillus songbeiensis]